MSESKRRNGDNRLGVGLTTAAIIIPVLGLGAAAAHALPEKAAPAPAIAAPPTRPDKVNFNISDYPVTELACSAELSEVLGDGVREIVVAVGSEAVKITLFPPQSDMPYTLLRGGSGIVTLRELRQGTILPLGDAADPTLDVSLQPDNSILFEASCPPPQLHSGRLP